MYSGFDKGVFGGNFHTHNSIIIPPGLDVVCYSNGADYVRGLRYAMRQVRVRVWLFIVGLFCDICVLCNLCVDSITYAFFWIFV
jgi:hypothetical protein